jgi:hypothetical protein
VRRRVPTRTPARSTRAGAISSSAHDCGVVTGLDYQATLTCAGDDGDDDDDDDDGDDDGVGDDDGGNDDGDDDSDDGGLI